jgi:hypothetical protein
MISKEHFNALAEKYGEFASWAVWAAPSHTPKSNIGDLSIFDLDKNSNLLSLLNPNIVICGLNFSRTHVRETFRNFHDYHPVGQDYKLRYAVANTIFYGSYLTDIIKDFEEKNSGNVVRYLKTNLKFKEWCLTLFESELRDLNGNVAPLIIALGGETYNILLKEFGTQYRVLKVSHYARYINPEIYRNEFLELENKLISR